MSDLFEISYCFKTTLDGVEGQFEGTNRLSADENFEDLEKVIKRIEKLMKKHAEINITFSNWNFVTDIYPTPKDFIISRIIRNPSHSGMRAVKFDIVDVRKRRVLSDTEIRNKDIKEIFLYSFNKWKSIIQIEQHNKIA